MQFTKLILAAAAFAVTNAIQFTNPTFNGIVAGSPFNVSWSGASGAVTLILKNGDSNNLQTVSTIASGLTGTSYTWTPSTSLPSGVYALQIQDSTSTANYSPQFTLTGGSATASLSSSASSSSTTSSILTSIAGNLTSSVTTATATRNSTATNISTATKSGSTTGSSSKTGSSTGSGSTGTSTSAPNSAAGIASPLAMVFLALAAIVCLN